MTRINRLFFILGFLITAAVLLCGPRVLTGQEPSVEGQGGSVPLQARVTALWQERRALLAQGNPGGAEAKLNELSRLKETVAIPHFDLVARLLVNEGYQYLASGEQERASASFDRALEFDPAFFQARYGLGDLARKRGQYAGFVQNRAKGYAIKHDKFWPSYFSTLAVVAVVGLGLVTSAIACLLLMAIKYQRLLRHDIVESLQTSMHPAIAAFAGWLVLLLPIVLAFDVFWWALWCGAILFGYFRIRERAVAVASMVILFLALPLLAVYSSLLTPLSDEGLKVRIKSAEGVVDLDSITYLSEQTAQSADFDSRVLLGDILLKNGELRDAERLYRDALTLRGDVKALNNLANIHYRLSEFDLAYENWNKAIKIAEATNLALAAAPYYNLSVYYNEKYDFNLQKTFREKGKSLDPALFQDSSSLAENRVLDIFDTHGAPGREVWAEAFSAAKAQVRSGVVRPQPVAAILAVVAAVVLDVRRKKKGYAVSCLKCGHPYCRRCNPTPPSREYCQQCAHLFIKRDGVSPQMRQDKLKEIAGHMFRGSARSKIAGALCPGAQHILGDAAILGFGVSIVWWVLVWTALSWFRLPEPSSVFAYNRSGFGLAICLVSMAVLWLAVNLRSWFARS